VAEAERAARAVGRVRVREAVDPVVAAALVAEAQPGLVEALVVMEGAEV